MLVVVDGGTVIPLQNLTLSISFRIHIWRRDEEVDGRGESTPAECQYTSHLDPISLELKMHILMDSSGFVSCPGQSVPMTLL